MFFLGHLFVPIVMIPGKACFFTIYFAAWCCTKIIAEKYLDENIVCWYKCMISYGATESLVSYIILHIVLRLHAFVAPFPRLDHGCCLLLYYLDFSFFPVLCLPWLFIARTHFGYLDSSFESEQNRAHLGSTNTLNVSYCYLEHLPNV